MQLVYLQMNESGKINATKRLNMKNKKIKNFLAQTKSFQLDQKVFSGSIIVLHG